MQPSASLPLMGNGTGRSSGTHPGQSWRQCRGGLPRPDPSGWPRTLRRRCGRRSRTPPARRQPGRPPAWRPRRARGDAERMLAQFRAEAACERDELRADVRARAERAEREADAYRAELAQLRAGAGHDAGAKTARAGHIPAVRAPTRGEATGRFALRGIDARRPKVTRQLDVTKVPRSRDLRRAYRAGLWRLPVQEAPEARVGDAQRRRGSWLTQSCLGTELGRQCYRCGRDPGTSTP